MRRRLLAGVVIGLVSGFLGVPPGAASAAAAGTLTVPGTVVSGDIEVTAQVPDATAYPYLQVRLARPERLVAPYAAMLAIDPPPVANPGDPVAVTVPTWGLVGDGVFALLGCTSAAASSCATLLTRVSRTIAVGAPVAAEVTSPCCADIVFVPEQSVRVTGPGGEDVDNPGGGHLVAGYGGVVQPVADDAVTVLDRWVTPTWSGGVTVRRCSDLVDEATQGTAYCETLVTRDLTVITEPALDLRLSRSVVTTDPRLSGSTVVAHASVVRTYLDPELSWRLDDLQGQTVAGPVPVTFGFASASARFAIDPQAHATGRLTTGTYRLVLTETLRLSGLAKTKDFSYPFRVDVDPPADRPRVSARSLVVRPSSDLHPEWTRMHYLVQGYPGDTRAASLEVRDDGGRLVSREGLGNPCSFVEDCAPFVWQPQVDVSSWAPGPYTATLTMPDSFGRLMRVPLPAFTVQDRVEVHTHVWRRARKVDVPEASRTGRCTRLRQTGRPKGSVGLYSGVGCRTHRHRADVVSRIFRLRMPAADGDYERLDQVLSRLEYRRSGSRGQVRIQLRVPSIDPHWTHPHRVIRSGRRLWAGYADIRPDLHTDYRGAAMEVRVRAWGGARIDVLRVSAAPEYDVWR